MPGPRTFRPNKPGRLAAAVLIGLFAFWGCSGSKETEVKAARSGPAAAPLERYERTFNPADYDADIKLVKQEEKTRRSELEPANLVTTAAPETVQGFRVQVSLTQDIDEAVRVKDSVDRLLPDQWTYIVYDAPYYKVRVGNWEDRASANPVLKKLGSLGFREAWIVPDNVLKNLPPKPPELNIEPEKQIENRRQ